MVQQNLGSEDVSRSPLFFIYLAGGRKRRPIDLVSPKGNVMKLEPTVFLKTPLNFAQLLHALVFEIESSLSKIVLSLGVFRDFILHIFQLIFELR